MDTQSKLDALYALLVAYGWMVPVISGMVNAVKEQWTVTGIYTHLVAALCGVAIVLYIELLVPLSPVVAFVGIGIALGFGSTGLVALPATVAKGFKKFVSAT